MLPTTPPDTTPFQAALVATLEALFVCTLIIISVKNYGSLRRYLDSKRPSKARSLPPGPVGWPMIGSVPGMFRHRPVDRWILNMMAERETEIACVRFGNTHVIPITCPVIAREVFKHQDSLFASRPLSLPQSILTGGYQACIFSPFGDQWKKMRKVLRTRIICPTRFEWSCKEGEKEADHVTAWVHNLCKASKPVELRAISRHYSGNVMRRLIFGKRYIRGSMPDGGPGHDDVKLINAFFDGLACVFGFGVADYLPALTWLDLNGHKKTTERANSVIDEFIDPILDARIKEWREEQKTDRNTEDFLDVFISLKDSGRTLLNREEIKAQVKELMIAGVDNTSNAVEWAMAEMMKHPEILKKAVDELDRVVGLGRQVQESDISELNYVKACLRETFRLHPLSIFNPPHVALSDATVAGYHIPKGSHVLVSRYGLGRNEKVWADPLQFRPERHLEDCSHVNLSENDLRFITFSTGRRGCVAPALGTFMSVVLFGRLLHGFSWRLPSGSDGIDLRESSGYLFMATPLVLMGEPRLPPYVYPSVIID